VNSKKQIRAKAARMLPEVFRRDRGKCRYCGKRVVMVRSIPEHRRVGKRHGDWVKFVDEHGKHRRELVATVDHLQRVDEGGDSDIDNMVLACGPCNRMMDLYYQQLRKL